MGAAWDAMCESAFTVSFHPVGTLYILVTGVLRFKKLIRSKCIFSWKYLDVMERDLGTCKQDLYLNYNKILAELSNSKCGIYFISAKVYTFRPKKKKYSIRTKSVTKDTSFYQFIHIYTFRIQLRAIINPFINAHKNYILL